MRERLRALALASALAVGPAVAQDLDVSVQLDARINAQQPVGFRVATGDDGIVAIAPADPEMTAAWTGGGAITTKTWADDHGNWQNYRAFLSLDLTLANGDAARAAALQVARSEPLLRPMLELHEYSGCVGFRPYFGLVDHGWGAVEDASLEFRFTAAAGPVEALDQSGRSRVQEVAVAGFEGSTVIELGPALEALGVDAAALRTGRFNCSGDLSDGAACLAEMRDRVSFGEVAGFVGLGESSFGGSDGTVVIGIDGTLRYVWRDAGGNRQETSQPLRGTLRLAIIENLRSRILASMYWDEGTDAPTFQPVELQAGQVDYTLPISLSRDGRSTAAIKLKADRASAHVMRAIAQSGDGGWQTGPWMRFFYLVPRPAPDTAAIRAKWPAECLPGE